jgi:hypothetical protein
MCLSASLSMTWITLGLNPGVHLRIIVICRGILYVWSISWNFCGDQKWLHFLGWPAMPIHSRSTAYFCDWLYHQENNVISFPDERHREELWKIWLLLWIVIADCHRRFYLLRICCEHHTYGGTTHWPPWTSCTVPSGVSCAKHGNNFTQTEQVEL